MAQVIFKFTRFQIINLSECLFAEFKSYATVDSSTQNAVFCDIVSATSITSYSTYAWTCSSGTPTASVCSWFGVTCDGTGAITALDISDQGDGFKIKGTLPSSIGKLVRHLTVTYTNYNV